MIVYNPKSKAEAVVLRKDVIESEFGISYEAWQISPFLHEHANQRTDQKGNGDKPYKKKVKNRPQHVLYSDSPFR